MSIRKKELWFSCALLALVCLILYQGHRLLGYYSSIGFVQNDTNTTGHRQPQNAYEVEHENTAASPKPAVVKKLQEGHHEEEYEGDGERVNVTVLGVNDKGLKEIMMDPECQKVIQNPRAIWRTSNSGDQFTADEDYEKILLAYNKCGGMLFLEDFMRTPPRDVLYRFEKEYFQFPPLSSMLEVISETHTTVQLVNNSKTYRVGDRVHLLIHARDFRNMSRHTGGDEIRVWLKTIVDKKTQTSNEVAAEVIDLRNGSYLAKALLPWAGKLRLFVALAYPREHIRAILHFLQLFKGLRMVVGRYENSKASEVTPCFHAPVIPGFSKDENCNLTSTNGSPWFCGRPAKKSLSCDDYSGTRLMTSKFLKAMFLSDAEFDLVMRSDRPPRKRIISSNHYLTVEPGQHGQKNIAPSRQMCHSIDPRKTWEAREKPSGYFLQGKWQSFLCTGLEMKSRSCLENKQIIFLGDSNARNHYDNIKSKLRCVEVLTRSAKIWHKPLKCVSGHMNTVVSWHPHTQPFMSYSHKWSGLEDLVAAVHVLDKAPSDDRQHWIVLHHYIHLTAFHISVFEAKLRAIKEALVRLFHRLPDARVVVQGGHIAWTGWKECHYTAGDQLGNFVTEIQRNVFRDLQDKVFFVSFWDPTIASENTGFHPVGRGAYMTKAIFDYLCNE